MANTRGPKIGGLWLREQRGGGDYMTGEIEIDGVRQRVVVFRNGYRTETNRQPHYCIYKDQPSQATGSPSDDATPGEMSSGPENWR